MVAQFFEGELYKTLKQRAAGGINLFEFRANSGQYKGLTF